MGLNSKQLVVGGTGLLGLVVRGAIQRNGGSLEGFYVFKPIYIYIFEIYKRLFVVINGTEKFI
jgi:hypothetical protein